MTCFSNSSPFLLIATLMQRACIAQYRVLFVTVNLSHLQRKLQRKHSPVKRSVTSQTFYDLLAKKNECLVHLWKQARRVLKSGTHSLLSSFTHVWWWWWKSTETKEEWCHVWTSLSDTWSTLHTRIQKRINTCGISQMNFLVQQQSDLFFLFFNHVNNWSLLIHIYELPSCLWFIIYKSSFPPSNPTF